MALAWTASRRITSQGYLLDPRPEHPGMCSPARSGLTWGVLLACDDCLSMLEDPLLDSGSQGTLSAGLVCLLFHRCVSRRQVHITGTRRASSPSRINCFSARSLPFEALLSMGTHIAFFSPSLLPGLPFAFVPANTGPLPKADVLGCVLIISLVGASWGWPVVENKPPYLRDDLSKTGKSRQLMVPMPQ
jgi:hypothetical protein